MIVPEPSPGQIAAGLKKMTDQPGGMAHMLARREAVSLYQGLGLREAVLKLMPETLRSQITVDTLPVARKVLDGRFACYRTAPVRQYEEETLDGEVWGNRDEIMPVLERLTGLLGTEALLVTGNDQERPTALHFVLLTEFEPIFVGTDPEPVGVAYPVAAYDASVKAEDREWECWTDTLRFIANGRGQLGGASDEERVNPYGVVPVMVAHRETQIGPSWWRSIAQDALDAQLTYNVLGAQHNAGCLLQALGQPVMTGVRETGGKAPHIELGPHVVLKLADPQGDFKFSSPTADLSALMEAQRWKMDALCFRYGIKAKWASDGGATSGEHQRLLEIELSNLIGSDFARWGKYERDLHDLALKIAERMKLKPLGTLKSVDFAEPNVPLSPEQQYEVWKREYDSGLATKKNYFRMKNPDMTDEAIQELLDAIAAERAADRTAPALREPGLADLLAGPVV